MTLDFNETGRLRAVIVAVTDYLDQQSFVYPDFNVTIAGMRAGVVGLCVGCSNDAVATIIGHLQCDGSMIESTLSVNIIGVK